MHSLRHRFPQKAGECVKYSFMHTVSVYKFRKTDIYNLAMNSTAKSKGKCNCLNCLRGSGGVGGWGVCVNAVRMSLQWLCRSLNESPSESYVILLKNSYVALHSIHFIVGAMHMHWPRSVHILHTLRMPFKNLPTVTKAGKLASEQREPREQKAGHPGGSVGWGTPSACSIFGLNLA